LSADIVSKDIAKAYRNLSLDSITRNKINEASNPKTGLEILASVWRQGIIR
jgi:hypothetical protein